MRTDFDFRSFTFGKGEHKSRKDGLCIMEAVSYVAGEPHSDHPECSCPVISAFMRSWNDSINDDDVRRDLLGPYVFRLVGTRATPEIETRRSFMAIDWCVRDFLPAWIELAKLDVEAAAVRALPEIIDMPTLISAGELISRVAKRAAAAWAAARDAAGDAAWAAARDAAWAAAGDAAGDAARYAARDAAWAAAVDAAWAAAVDAAWAAAWAAAWDAAWAAAWDAAGDALQPTVDRLQKSACDLLDRMIALTEPAEAETSSKVVARC